jgi:hypothetical protein
VEEEEEKEEEEEEYKKGEQVEVGEGKQSG